MRISAKGRYALAAMIDIARHAVEGECITVISIAERLGISKIYLEQVFSLLKKGGLVNSIKGAQGGYQLAQSPAQITALDILSQVESTLFERSDDTVLDKVPYVDAAMRVAVFDSLDQAIESTLKQVTLQDLVNESEKQNTENDYMFFI